VDGGHNVEGITSFVQTLKDKNVLNPIFVFGLSNDKQKLAMIRKIKSMSNSFYLVQSQVAKATPVLKLKKLFQTAGYLGKLDLSTNMTTALPKALKQARQEKRAVCVCGSLYLVGETFSTLNKENAKN